MTLYEYYPVLPTSKTLVQFIFLLQAALEYFVTKLRTQEGPTERKSSKPKLTVTTM
jgi:hypothetical protein